MKQSDTVMIEVGLAFGKEAFALFEARDQLESDVLSFLAVLSSKIDQPTGWQWGGDGDLIKYSE
jgi:hypothetical protein